MKKNWSLGKDTTTKDGTWHVWPDEADSNEQPLQLLCGAFTRGVRQRLCPEKAIPEHPNEAASNELVGLGADQSSHGTPLPVLVPLGSVVASESTSLGGIVAETKELSLIHI